MIRNKLYDELEKEGYTFTRLRVSSDQSIPKVENMYDSDDWALVNTSMVINGQYQVDHGSGFTPKTLVMLQRVIDETSKPDYYDYISESIVESTSV